MLLTVLLQLDCVNNRTVLFIYQRLEALDNIEFALKLVLEREDGFIRPTRELPISQLFSSYFVPMRIELATCRTPLHWYKTC